jgi:hypothetical protein
MDFNEVNTVFVREGITFCLRKEALIIDAVLVWSDSDINLSNATLMADCYVGYSCKTRFGS